MPFKDIKKKLAHGPHVVCLVSLICMFGVLYACTWPYFLLACQVSFSRRYVA